MDINELKLLQNYPLDIKIAKSKQRIMEFVRYFGTDGVYVSFSGGKDSSVLLHLVRSIYPEVPAVFSNTGVEFPELVDHVKNTSNVVIMQPKKSFPRIIKEEGYPVVSKKVSRAIRDLKHPTEKNKNIRNLYLTGKTMKGFDCPSRKLAKKWYYLIDSPFEVTEKCCNYLKKEPFHRYEKETGRKPFIGTMTEESKDRQIAYLNKGGCNSFDEDKGRSAPLSFWTNQDILEYIIKYNVKIPSVYGKIIRDEETGLLKTTGEQRTGCYMCLFGIHMEKGENRIQRLKKTHPKQWHACVNGLKFKEVMEYMDIPYE